MSRYLIDPESIRNVRLVAIAVPVAGLVAALIVLKPVWGLLLLSVVLGCLVVDLWRQGIDAASEVGRQVDRATTAEGHLASTSERLSKAEAQRDASRARLIGPTTLADVLATVTEMRSVATLVRSGRAESEEGATRRSVVKFVLDGEVRVTIAGPVRAPFEEVSLVGPTGVSVERLRLEADGPSQCSGTCLLADLPALSADLELAGSLSPEGYYVDVPGAVSRTFAGVQDEDVARLEEALETLHKTVETAIMNRVYDDN